MAVADLPLVDEHSITIAAPADAAWAGVLDAVDGALGGSAGGAYARLVGCADAGPGGPRPLTEGSSITGFHVEAAIPPSTLILAGRHRFSDYALLFHIEEIAGGRSRVRAETRAAFPGLAGRVYRLLVIGTRGHVLAVRRLLSRIKSTAERAAGRNRSG